MVSKVGLAGGSGVTVRDTTSRAVHTTFKVGVIFKGVDGALQIAGATLLLFLKPGQIRHAVGLMTRRVLSRDPDDRVANYLLRAADQLSVSHQLFASLYLLSHGVVKVLLVWALLRSKLWAYPAAILIFAAFSAYQIYDFVISHSIVMLVLTILDVVVIVLTWAEYGRLRHSHSV
jgi:uncharacterized membrane protein